MGAELALAFPDLADAFEASHARLRPRAGEAQAALPPPGVIGRILGAAVLCAFHAEFTRGVLGIQPDAAIGYSSGESAALVALGAWTDPAALNHDVHASELLATDLTGEFRAVRRAWRRLGVTGERWVSYLVSAPADQVRAALGDQAAAYLMAINAPDACIIGGEEAACEAVLRRLAGVAVIPIDYGIAAHAPVLADVAEEYRRLHWRPTADLPGVRFYSGATGESYRASADRAADALAAQILGPIDFVRVIERAWADGVRVFIEHGPQAQCTGWIRRILGDRAHLSVALDAPGGRGTRQLGQVVAELVAAGVGGRRGGVLRPSRRGCPGGGGQDRDDPAARPSARDAAARTRTTGGRHAAGAETGAGGGQLHRGQRHPGQLQRGQVHPARHAQRHARQYRGRTAAPRRRTAAPQRRMPALRLRPAAGRPGRPPGSQIWSRGSFRTSRRCTGTSWPSRRRLMPSSCVRASRASPP